MFCKSSARGRFRFVVGAVVEVFSNQNERKKRDFQKKSQKRDSLLAFLGQK